MHVNLQATGSTEPRTRGRKKRFPDAMLKALKDWIETSVAVGGAPTYKQVMKKVDEMEEDAAKKIGVRKKTMKCTKALAQKLVKQCGACTAKMASPQTVARTLAATSQRHAFAAAVGLRDMLFRDPRRPSASDLLPGNRLFNLDATTLYLSREEGCKVVVTTPEASAARRARHTQTQTTKTVPLGVRLRFYATTSAAGGLVAPVFVWPEAPVKQMVMLPLEGAAADLDMKKTAYLYLLPPKAANTGNDAAKQRGENEAAEDAERKDDAAAPAEGPQAAVESQDAQLVRRILKKQVLPAIVESVNPLRGLNARANSIAGVMPKPSAEDDLAEEFAQRIVFLMDGDYAQLQAIFSDEVVQFISNNNIRVGKLSAGCSHVQQPNDKMRLFCILKRLARTMEPPEEGRCEPDPPYFKQLEAWVNANVQTSRTRRGRPKIALILEFFQRLPEYLRAASIRVIKRGWKTTGIFPYNADVILNQVSASSRWKQNERQAAVGALDKAVKKFSATGIVNDKDMDDWAEQTPGGGEAPVLAVFNR